MMRSGAVIASRRFRALAAGAMCVALLAVAPSAVPELATSHIGLSSQALARYSSSHSLVDLSAAVNSLDGTIDVNVLTPDNFVITRRSLAQAWVNVLKSIEGAYDPNYNITNPKDTPVLCPPRPPSATGLGCVPPGNIGDPAQRAAYIAATKENDSKRANLSHYLAVKKLDDWAMSGLAMSLKFLNPIAPQNAGADFAALDSIVINAGLSSARHSKIDAMIYDEAKR